ncbi:hypothetical protein ACET3Z_004608 [Daucus carota]
MPYTYSNCWDVHLFSAGKESMSICHSSLVTFGATAIRRSPLSNIDQNANPGVKRRGPDNILLTICSSYTYYCTTLSSFINLLLPQQPSNASTLRLISPTATQHCLLPIPIRISSHGRDTFSCYSNRVNYY